MSLPDEIADGANPISPDLEKTCLGLIAVSCPVHDCRITVDIVLQATDGTEYGAHIQNLQDFSGRFPTVDSVVLNSGDRVLLSEGPDILRLMLGFMHHGPPPDLSQELFETVGKLADSAEKYLIYQAMAICKLQMELRMQTMPLLTLRYAWTYNYADLANTIAPRTLSYSPQVAQDHLQPLVLLAAWYKYRTHWEEVFAQINTVYLPNPVCHKGGGLKCRYWKAFHPAVRQALHGISRSYTAFSEVSEVVPSNMHLLYECKYCTQRAEIWRRRISQITMPYSFSEMF